MEVAAIRKIAKSSEVFRALKSIFARHNTPEQVRSDNVPQFDSAEFSHFAKEWSFRHTTSGPRFPQSNGEVERGVKTVKNLLMKEKDPAKGLLAYRSTPLACKFSPAQLLMERQIRNSVPMFHTQLNPKWPDLDKLRERESTSKLKQETVFNSRHKARALSPIEPGAEVYVKDLQRSGTVVKAAETRRSYEVKTYTSTARNRAHLTPMWHLQQQHQQQPTLTMNNVPAENKASTPRKIDIPNVPPVLPLLATRPMRVFKPSLS